jgi:hypothetical protein
MSAHRRKIAQVDSKRAMADGRGRRIGAEVHSFDEGVDSGNKNLPVRNAQQRRIIADPELNVAARCATAAEEARDELKFRQRHGNA